MLNSEKVSYFLEQTIGFKSWDRKLQENKLEFLRDFTNYFISNIYFQTITMASVAPEDRRPPSTTSEIIEKGLSGRGGVCIDLNYFAYTLLSFLGFDCIVVQGTYTTSCIIGNHCATIVKLSDEEKYLVDVGSILPGSEVIPMHKLPFRFMGGGLIQEWRLCDDGVYRRYQIGGKLFKDDDFNDSIEEVRVEIFPEPKQLEDYAAPMKDVFTNTEKSFLLNTSFLFRYLDHLNVETSKFVYIWGTKLLVGDKNSRKVTRYANLKEIIPVIEEYFPKIDKVELKRAMEYFESIYTQGNPTF